jgi:hypothetical protein
MAETITLSGAITAVQVHGYKYIPFRISICIAPDPSSGKGEKDPG